MNTSEKIDLAKKFFRERFFDVNAEKACKLQLGDFQINPFLIDYLALLAGGDNSSLSKAKALVYPRVFGTSITTSFGTNVQTLLTEIGLCKGSAIQGMDIEFDDMLDGRKKYAQVKASKQTINKKDVKPLIREYDDVLYLARTNHLPINNTDLVVGVLYGEGELSPFFKEIDKRYPVFMGRLFWQHITGSDTFYDELIKAIKDVSEEYAYVNDEIRQTIIRIAREIDEQNHTLL